MFAQMTEQLAVDVLSGQAIAFLGSGFSRGASNYYGDEFPTGTELSALLGKELGIDVAGYSLETIAEHFYFQKGRPALYRFLQTQFLAQAVTEMQIEVLRLPWRRIYTTNFDNVAEKALASLKKTSIIIDLDCDPRRPIPEGAIVHLNGSIELADEGNFLDKIRLTSSTYYDNRIEESGWGRRFLRDIAHARSIVFLGYSLFDADIAKLLRENPSFRKKTFFIEANRDDPIKFTKLRGFGEVLPIGIDGCISSIKDAQVPLIAGDSYFVSFDHIKPPDEMRTLSVDDVRDFYISGKNATQIAFLHDADRVNVVTRRAKVDQVISDIASGVSRFVLHSRLGNGKTVFLWNLAADLIAAGYEVFWFHQDFEDSARELELIKSFPRAVVFIENVFGREEVVQFVAENLGPSVSVLVTCRTAGFDLRHLSLEKTLGGPYAEINLNNLSDVERGGLVCVMNSAGFWGPLAAERDDRKAEAIRSWGNELRAVLLKLFTETDLKDRIRSHIEVGISKDSRLKRIIILSFLLKLAEARAEFDVLDELLGISSYSVLRQNEEIVRDLFDISSDRVAMRSSVLGEYCLRYIFADEDVVNVLADVARVQSRMGRWDDEIWSILKSFMRYGFVEPLLTSSRKRNLLLNYYETLRGLGSYIRRPLFWLQYAIAEMSVSRYEPAKTFLDTAKSYASKIPGFKTNQIDNHYARYLLESRSRSGEYNDFAVAFYKASALLSKEIASEGTSYYTARVVRYVAEYFRKATPRLSVDEKLECTRRLSVIEGAIRKKMREMRVSHPRFEEAILAISQAKIILDGGECDVFIIGYSDDFVLD